jgi:hypothetical protein
MAAAWKSSKQNEFFLHSSIVTCNITTAWSPSCLTFRFKWTNIFTSLDSLQNSGTTTAVPIHDKKMYGGLEAQIHSFLNSELDGDERSASYPDRFTPIERARHQLNRCLGWPPVRFRRFGKERNFLPGNEPFVFGHPVCSLVFTSSECSMYLFSKECSWYITTTMGRYNSVGTATRYRLEGPGIEFRRGKIFRTSSDRP